MKVGAAYLCIDHSFPDERITFTVSDSASKVVITNKGSYPLEKYNYFGTFLSRIVVHAPFYDGSETKESKVHFFTSKNRL